MLKLLPAFLMVSILGAGISSGQPGSLLSPLQGGEDIANAYVLPGPLPIISGGTTAGYNDDYDETCPYSGSTAPDVVYAFTPASGIIVNIDLCGSSFDTKLYVYENALTLGSPYDCNDDFYFEEPCGVYVSKIEGVFLAGGNTYYIVIDGYSETDFGDYSLTISEDVPPPPCVWGVDIACPPGAVPETEVCGNEQNGGCNMPAGTEYWEPLPASGMTFCGTTWADGGTRDNDWFELTLSEVSLLILTANADQEILYGLIETTIPGAPSCETITGFISGDLAGPCSETTVDLGMLGPGTYWFFVGMSVFDGFPCENHYWIDFNVIPVSCPPPVDLSVTSITTTTGMLEWTESGTATAWEYQVGPSGFLPGASGIATTSNPQLVTGLTVNTDYDFYVRSFCDPEYSIWEGPFSFSTLCHPLTIFPWSEDFESTWPPDCWSDTEAADYGWSLSTYGIAHSGLEWAYCNLEGSVLSTPSFTLASAYCLSFWFRVESEYYPQSFNVKIGNNIIYQVAGATNETYESVQISLADYTGQTISVSFNGETGTGAYDFGICLDDVSVKLFNTWKGTAGSSWNTIGNWTLGTVPTMLDPVLIPSVPAGPNFPVISGGITAECDFISVSPGATLRVVSGSTLDVKNP